MAKDTDGPVYTPEGDRFRAAMAERRNELGMTQKDLGDAIGCSTGYCSEIESGKKQFNEKRMSAICSALGITVRFGPPEGGEATEIEEFFAPFPPEMRALIEAMRASFVRKAGAATLSEEEVPVVTDSLALFQSLYKDDRPEEARQAGKLRRQLTKS